jgi:hypothetical protein
MQQVKTCGQCPFAVYDPIKRFYICTARHEYKNMLVVANDRAKEPCNREIEKFILGEDYLDDHHLNNAVAHPTGNRSAVNRLKREREDHEQQLAEDTEFNYSQVLVNQDNYSQTQAIPELNLWLQIYDCELQPVGNSCYHLRSVEGDLIAIIRVGDTVKVSVGLPNLYETTGNDFLVTVGKVAKQYKNWRDRVIS